MGRKDDQELVLKKRKRVASTSSGRQEKEKKDDDDFVSLSTELKTEEEEGDHGGRLDDVIVVGDETQETPEVVRKKRLSKKGKKAWRKNIDESKALDAITTDRWKREAETGFADGIFIDKKRMVKRKKLQDMTPVERRNFHREKFLASEGGLIPLNKVVPVPMPKKRKLSEDNQTPMARERVHKLTEKLKKHPSAAATPSPPTLIPHLREQTAYDLWNEDTPQERKSRKSAPPEGGLLPTSKLGKNKIPHKPEASAIRAVEIPLPGISINPSYEDHQDALGVAVALVRKIDEEEVLLAKRLQKPMSKKEERRRRLEGTLDVELLEAKKEEEESEREEEEEEPKKKKPTYDPEFSTKKSEKERRKEKLKKERRRAERHRISQKRRMSKVDLIPQLLTSFEKKEEISKRRQERRQEKKQEELFKPRRLGKFKMELDEMIPDVLPTDELPENGRLLAIQGRKVSLIRDRFRNMMKRNLVEPRIKQVKARKYKLKWHTKPSKRDF